VFPARYELNSYIVFRERLVSKRLIDGSGVVDIEINIEKTKYMLLSYHQNAGSNRDRSFENVIIVQIFWNESKNSEFD
jgi:hypothetical protein